jgi:hypothetical protein
MQRHCVSIMRFMAAALAVAGLALVPASGQQAAGQQAPGQQTARPVYRPGVGDLMTGSLQPRHIKLAAAGQSKNWAYAAYTLHELGESLDRVVFNFPNIRQMPTADLMAAFMKAPMAALDEAVKAADPVRFKAAYAQLTDGCNGCHQQTERSMVVIQVPDAVTIFPDQNFAPAKP